MKASGRRGNSYLAVTRRLKYGYAVKIILTTHLFFPEHYAGTEVLVVETAKELMRRGHEVLVVTGSRGGLDPLESEYFDRYLYNGIQVIRYNPGRGEQDDLADEYNNRVVADYFSILLKEFTPDIVHFFHWANISASIVDVCGFFGVPMVLTPTDFWYVCHMAHLRLPGNEMCPGPDRNRLNCLCHLDATTKPEKSIVRLMPRWLLSLLLWLAGMGLLPQKRFSFINWVVQRPGFLLERMNRMSKIMTPSRLMERVFADNGVNPALMEFAPFGLNLSYIKSEIRAESNLPLKVGFIGLLAEHKGINILIDAFKLLSKQYAAELVIYGENKLQPEFELQLKLTAAEDSRIRFAGTFPNDQIGRVFSEIDLLVVPSIWYENTPLVIYSAQAAGCPVVATNLGGMAEVVKHGVNGMLFESGDVIGLMKILQGLAEDRHQLRKLSEGSVAPRSIEDYVDQLLRVYEKFTHAA